MIINPSILCGVHINAIEIAIEPERNQNTLQKHFANPSTHSHSISSAIHYNVMENGRENREKILKTC